MDDREFWLATTLVELADISGDEATYCGLLAARLAKLLDPAEIGVLMADGSDTLKAVAASSERASRMTSLEEDGEEGPAAGCLGSGRPVLNESLDEACQRWPRFAADARAAGFVIVSALPVRRHDKTIGVIGVFSAAGHRIDDGQIRLAQVLAEAAAVAILQLRALRDSVEAARQLREALVSRIFVEQAKGALAARLDITPDAAFGLLRGYARTNGVLLAEVAGATVRGELTPQELLAGGGTYRRQAGRRQSVHRE
jgi:transcriptional regulator with GAF, ATPase, and Fis domain